MSVVLYEFAPTRSRRVRWTLQELDVPFDSIEGRDVIGSERLRKVHPLGKIPAIEDDGRPLYESAAICTWLADKYADRGFIAQAGTWGRALHDQWVCFALAEVEAHLWSSFRNTVVYPEEKRLPVIIDQNNAEVKRSLPALDSYLADHEYLVGDKFSVTDIIVGLTINWARNDGLTEEFEHLNAYDERLRERPLCPLNLE